MQTILVSLHSTSVSLQGTLVSLSSSLVSLDSLQLAFLLGLKISALHASRASLPCLACLAQPHIYKTQLMLGSEYKHAPGLQLVQCYK